jgi:lipopolysaccharide biosynthesis glycosyltransferase
MNPLKYVAVTIDSNYVQHCGVMLVSLFENNIGENFYLFIIHNGISVSEQELLKKQIKFYNQQAEFILIDESLLKEAPVSSHISLATYYRLLLPKILPTHVQLILFLDCDIIIRGSVAKLWEEITENDSHLAAENPLISEDFKLRLGLSADSKYFNAGVMLVNLNYWREIDLTNKSIDFIAHNVDKITFWDQDVLNNILENKWKEISFLWNAQEIFFHPDFDAKKIGIAEDYYNEIKENPYILHFTGSNKPWFLEVNHPFKKDYLYYLSKSIWAGTPLKQLTQKINQNEVNTRLNIKTYIKSKLIRLKNKLKNVWNSRYIAQSK